MAADCKKAYKALSAPKICLSIVTVPRFCFGFSVGLRFFARCDIVETMTAGRAVARATKEDNVQAVRHDVGNAGGTAGVNSS